MRPLGALLAGLLVACGPQRNLSAFFSFEDSLQGWEPHAADLQGPAGEDAWSITTDPTFPFDARSSVRFFLDDANGAGKIWLERTFTLPSSRRRTLHLDFATAGSSDALLPDRLIVGAFPAAPRSEDAIQSALQPAGIASFQWTSHAYDFEVDGSAVVVIVGVAGGTTGRVIYHLDAMTVLFTDL